MESTFESKYHSLEEDHFWFRGRRDIILKLLRNLHISSKEKILDVGCSGGSLIAYLQSYGFENLWGVDISEKAIEVCQSRGLYNAITSTGEEMPFSNEEFDVVVASDILEHIEDEGIALKEWKRILKPGGKLIIFVPAFNFLWSGHDTANHHFRRYTKSDLKRKLAQEDFMFIKTSYWNFSLFFFFTGKYILDKLTPKRFRKESGDRLYKLGQVPNQALTSLITTENNFLTRINFPIGLSVLAICLKGK